MFSGGDYQEVERWLRNFLASHAKRVDPRFEVALEVCDEREGKSYVARLRFGQRVTAAAEFDFQEVAANRGRLAWCQEVAERTTRQARELLADRGAGDARAR